MSRQDVIEGHCVRSALTPETVLPCVLPGLSSQDLFAGPAVHLQHLAPWLSPGCSACAKMHQHPGNAGNAVARLPVAGSSRLHTSVCSIFREAVSSLFLPDCTEETLLPACSLSSTSAIRLLPAFGPAGSVQTARHPWHCPLTLSCGAVLGHCVCTLTTADTCAKDLPAATLCLGRMASPVREAVRCQTGLCVAGPATRAGELPGPVHNEALKQSATNSRCADWRRV